MSRTSRVWHPSSSLLPHSFCLGNGVGTARGHQGEPSDSGSGGRLRGRSETCIRDAAGLRDPWGQDTDSLDRDVQTFLFTTGSRETEAQNAWVRSKGSEGEVRWRGHASKWRVEGCPYGGLFLQGGHHCPWILDAAMPLRSCGAAAVRSCGCLCSSVPEPGSHPWGRACPL